MKSIMRTKLLIVSLVLIFKTIFFPTVLVYAQAQEFSLNPTLNNIVPPSPNVSALMKFGAIPVSPSTGIPSISIPIYDFKSAGSGLKLAVSLDYHAGGVKVSEVGSNTGIGWVLNAGGAISRTLRGVFDELPAVGFINQSKLPNSLIEGNSPTAELDRPFVKIYANQLDGQPDIFNFSMNGRTGSFMYGKNGDFLMVNLQQMKVEKVIEYVNPEPGIGGRQMITKFILTDEEGFRYFFESYELTSNYSLQGVASRDYTSSWYLTKQVAPGNTDSIVYTYEPNNIAVYTVGRSAYSMEGVPVNGGFSHKEGTGLTSMSVLGQRLKSIKLPDGVTLDFEYKSEERTDLKGDHLLNKVTISYGAEKRGYYFIQDYSLNRATLKKVIPFNGVSEVQMPPYQFEYDIPLPDRLSFQQDHWGYYNNNTGGLIPEEIFPGKLETFYKLYGGNRDTDSVKVLAGSLRKVIYPTGGYTVFEMEPNKAYSNWLDQKFVTTEPGLNVEHRSASAYVATTDPYKSDYAVIAFNGLANTTTNFKITAPTSGTCNSNCKVILEMYAPNGSLLGTRELLYDNNAGVSVSFSLVNLVKGDYKFVFYTSGLTGFSTYVNVEWDEIIDPKPVTVIYEHKQPFVGGLRVKSITDYTSSGGQPINKKSFEYLTDDNVRSSGSLGVAPRYSFSAFYTYRLSGLPAGGSEDYATASPNNYISRSSSPVYDLTYTNGSPVTYNRVVERQQNNGRIERYFTSFYEASPIVEQGVPFIPTDYKPWLYGLQTKEVIYDENNRLLKKTENEYEYQEDKYFQDPVRMENFRAVSLAPVKYYYTNVSKDPQYYYWDYTQSPPLYYLYKDFYPAAGRANMMRQTAYTYDQAGNELKTETGSVFDLKKYYLKSSWNINSTNDTVKTTMNYPPDLTTGTDAGIYQAMIQRNIINVPVEKRLFVGGKPRGFTKTNYYSPFAGIYVPGNVQFQKESYPIETRITYSSYDEQGRVLTVKRDDGPSHAYKWGYNKQYVVAECTNALAEECFYTGFEEEGSIGNAHTGTKAYNGTYTTSDKLKPGLNGKKYIISYWSYTGGKWNFSGNLDYTGQVLTGTIDDVRIHPVDAQMTTYTYHPMYGTTTVTDIRGITTFYDYDVAGRLRTIRNHLGEIQKVFDYQYQQSLTK